MNEQQFKALPPEQRKAHQQRLQEQGLYVGKLDGNWGEGTKGAFATEAKQRADSESKADTRAAQERADRLKAEEFELEKAKLQQSGKAVDVDAETKKAELARKSTRDAEARSPSGIAQAIGANVAAPLAGYGVGRAFGAGLNMAADASQTKRNASLANAAAARLQGLTTREGSRIGAQLSGALPSSNSALRVGSRMLPHTITGLGMAAKGGAMLSQEDEEDPLITQNINRAAGLGMLGTGVGIMEKGAAYAVAPGVPPNAGDIAIIESNMLRRRPEVPDAPDPSSRAALLTDAKAAGVKGAAKMNKAQLTAALSKLKLPGLMAPFGAGAFAYGMTPDSAEAADGSGVPSKALTNAGVASATTAGTGYGLSQLLKRVPNMGRALGIGGGMSMPLAAMEIGPDTPEAANVERSRIAQNWPRLASMLGLTDEMGQQLPERNTGKTPELPNAAALQIPQGIPLPNSDGSSPYPEMMAPMGAGPQLPQQPQMPMRRPQLPYAAMGFGGRF